MLIISEVYMQSGVSAFWNESDKFVMSSGAGWVCIRRRAKFSVQGANSSDQDRSIG